MTAVPKLGEVVSQRHRLERGIGHGLANGTLLAILSALRQHDAPSSSACGSPGRFLRILAAIVVRFTLGGVPVSSAILRAKRAIVAIVLQSRAIVVHRFVVLNVQHRLCGAVNRAEFSLAECVPQFSLGQSNLPWREFAS